MPSKAISESFWSFNQNLEFGFFNSIFGRSRPEKDYRKKCSSPSLAHSSKFKLSQISWPSFFIMARFVGFKQDYNVIFYCENSSLTLLRSFSDQYFINLNKCSSNSLFTVLCIKKALRIFCLIVHIPLLFSSTAQLYFLPVLIS